MPSSLPALTLPNRGLLRKRPIDGRFGRIRTRRFDLHGKALLWYAPGSTVVRGALAIDDTATLSLTSNNQHLVIESGGNVLELLSCVQGDLELWKLAIEEIRDSPAGPAVLAGAAQAAPAVVEKSTGGGA